MHSQLYKLTHRQPVSWHTALWHRTTARQLHVQYNYAYPVRKPILVIT